MRASPAPLIRVLFISLLGPATRGALLLLSTLEHVYLSLPFFPLGFCVRVDPRPPQCCFRKFASVVGKVDGLFHDPHFCLRVSRRPHQSQFGCFPICGVYGRLRVGRLCVYSTIFTLQQRSVFKHKGSRRVTSIGNAGRMLKRLLRVFVVDGRQMGLHSIEMPTPRHWIHLLGSASATANRGSCASLREANSVNSSMD